MKVTMMKLTAAAALVVGMAGAAQASTPLSVHMQAAVEKGTCDIVSSNPASTAANFGTLDAASVFAAKTGTPIDSPVGPIMLNFSNCTTQLEVGDTVDLRVSGGVAANGADNQAFGDALNNVGYGFQLRADWVNGATSQTAATTATLTPAVSSVEIYNAREAVATGAEVTLPDVTLTPQLFSYVPAVGDIKTGTAIDSTVNVDVFYP